MSYIICCAATLAGGKKTKKRGKDIKKKPNFISLKVFLPPLLCAPSNSPLLLICPCKRGSICISNSHIWRGWFKCQDATWWQSPRLKASAKPSLSAADIKTKPTAATQAQYKYTFIWRACLHPPSTFVSLLRLSLRLIISISLYIWISACGLVGQQCASNTLK